MKKYSFFILTISSLLFANCEKIIEFPAEEKAPKIVVNSLFTHDSTWLLNLSLSRFILSSSPIQDLKNANIILTNNNGDSVKFEYKDYGYYVSQQKVKPQAEYELTVSHPQYGKVSATGSTPKFNPISKIEILNKIKISNDMYYDSYNTTYRRIRITIDDTPENNYYYLSLKTKYFYTEYFWDERILEYNYDSIVSQTYSENHTSFLTYNTNTDDIEDVYTYNYEGILFSDEKYNGQSYILDIFIDESILTFSQIKDSLSDNINKNNHLLEFRTLSKDYYFYLKSKELHQYTRGDYFSQPVQVYNNIKEGLGIFAGYSYKKYPLSFENVPDITPIEELDIYTENNEVY